MNPKLKYLSVIAVVVVISLISAALGYFYGEISGFRSALGCPAPDLDIPRGRVLETKLLGHSLTIGATAGYWTAVMVVNSDTDWRVYNTVIEPPAGFSTFDGNGFLSYLPAAETNVVETNTTPR